jgi:hypothetical protein
LTGKAYVNIMSLHRVNEFPIYHAERGHIMVTSKTKTVVKKAAPAKAATPAKKPAAPVKKAVVKKTVAAAPKTAKVPAVKKAAVPAAAKKAPAKKPAATKAPAKPTPEERYNMVATAAYFIAERNGFQGCSTEHWIQAEAEIAAKLGR